jgi:hypothetical protein
MQLAVEGRAGHEAWSGGGALRTKIQRERQGGLKGGLKGEAKREPKDEPQAALQATGRSAAR